MAAKFDHNSSMKKLQLAKPDIAQFVKNSGDYEYEVLLMDEAQDMNPAMLDICLNQVTHEYALEFTSCSRISQKLLWEIPTSRYTASMGRYVY